MKLNNDEDDKLTKTDRVLVAVAIILLSAILLVSCGNVEAATPAHDTAESITMNLPDGVTVDPEKITDPGLLELLFGGPPPVTLDKDLDDQDLFHIYLPSTINGIESYTSLIKQLKRLESKHTVRVHVANYGGQVMTGIQFIHALKASKAKIIIDLEGPSYSMGALITCAGDQVNYGDYAYLMFHTFSGNFGGKASDSEKHMDAIATLIKTVLQSECKPKGILNDAQIEDIMNGVDVYVHAKELKGKTNVSTRVDSSGNADASVSTHNTSGS